MQLKPMPSPLNTEIKESFVYTVIPAIQRQSQALKALDEELIFET